MLEGELALVRLSPDVAFGSKGLPDKVPPNSTLDCELELLEVQPHFSRIYKPVGFNESIKEELLESLESRSTTASSDLFGSNSGKTIAENRSMEDIKFFDPAKMKIDPRLTVGGEAIDHVWSENMHSMDVEVSLPLAMGGASKKDLRVTLRPTEIDISSVDGTFRFGGPLQGKIIVSESSWVLLGTGGDDSYSARDWSAR
eukprot:gene4007-5043_t